MHAGGQEFDPPRLHQHLRTYVKNDQRWMLRAVFNFDRFFAGIYGRHVILKFGNASSEKQSCSNNFGFSNIETVSVKKLVRTNKFFSRVCRYFTSYSLNVVCFKRKTTAVSVQSCSQLFIDEETLLELLTNDQCDLRASEEILAEYKALEKRRKECVKKHMTN